MKITLDEIARLANVSKTTVSRVINGVPDGVGESTRRRVLQIMQELGYDARFPYNGRLLTTKTLGMLLPDVGNPFFSTVFQSVSRSAACHGYTVLLCETGQSDSREAMAVDTLVSKRVDGIVLISSCPQWREFHSKIDKYRIPCVLLDRKIRQDASAGVFVDNEYASYMATSYLIQSGHFRIALLCGPASAPTSMERVTGYREAFLASGIRFDESLIRYGEFDLESGYRFLMKEGRASGATAILAGNDSIAVGAMKALKELGIAIPGEMELIGFDDTQLAHVVEPHLSTIQQPVEELGDTAVTLLLEMIGGGIPQEPIRRLKSRLLLRGTTRQAGEVRGPMA